MTALNAYRANLRDLQDTAFRYGAAVLTGNCHEANHTGHECVVTLHDRLLDAIANLALTLRLDGLNSPVATQVYFHDEMLCVALSDAREIKVPVAWYPRLRNATDVQRSNWCLIGNGEGIHWPDVDEDLSVEGLLAGIPSTEGLLAESNLNNGRVPLGAMRTYATLARQSGFLITASLLNGAADELEELRKRN